MIRFSLADKTDREEDTFTIDWSDFLGEDTLTGTPTAEVREGTIAVEDLANLEGKKTSFWIRGGTKGEVARAWIHVSTVEGRELDGEIVLGIR